MASAAPPAAAPPASVASAGSSQPTSVPSFELKGHSAPVLCLHAAGEKSAHPHLLLSGSEDSTCRVWDVRAGKAVRCLKAFGTTDNPSPAVTSVSFDARTPYAVFVGAEQTLHRFDLRVDREQVVVRRSQAQWNHHEEEINQIDINAQGTFLAACDDNGDVCIVDLQKNAAATGGQLFKTLSGKHTNLCTSVQFRPKQTWEVWSGGMDCEVVCWDYSRGRPTHTFSTQPTAASSSSNQTLNPPFVNGLSFTREGDTLLVASGNGEIVLYDARRKEERRRVLGHTHSVMHASALTLPPSFPALAACFTGGHAANACMISAGNDQNILLWDLQAILDAPRPAAPATAASSSSASSAAAAKNRKKKEKAKAKKASAASSAAASATAADDDDAEGKDDEDGAEMSLNQLSLGGSNGGTSSSSLWSSPSAMPSLPFSALEHAALDTRFVRYRWYHPRKINALATSAGMRDGSVQSASLDAPETLCTSGVCVYVADTSNNITAYQLK